MKPTHTKKHIQDGEVIMSKCCQTPRDTDCIKVDRNTKDWMDVVAENHGMSERQFAEKILRHGLVHVEEIVD